MSTEAESPNAEPTTSGLRPWRKGQSGNPNGRRAKGLATAERLRNALVKDLPAILKVIVTNAKAGDLNAAKTILERVLPPLKAIEVPTLLDELTGTLSQQGQEIIRAMADGRLAPGQASQLLMAIGAQAKILEVDEMARRIEAIEQQMGGNGTFKS